MARERAPRKRAAAARNTPERRLVTAALELAARQGWRRTGLAEIAAAAGLPLHEAYALHRSKAAILEAFSRQIDVEVLAGMPAAEADDKPRERLFDTLMRRLDALKPHKPAIRAILRDSLSPPAVACGLPGRLRSMRWMLEAAGISTAGCRGRLLVHLVLGLYVSVLRVFLQDDSPDLARTMAALDRGLRRGEALCHLGRARQAGAPGPA